jgi:hypothetical protein
LAACGKGEDEQGTIGDLKKARRKERVDFDADHDAQP